jgi:hypothetical protein
MVSKCSEHLATARKEGGSRSRGCSRRRGVEELGDRGAEGSRDGAKSVKIVLMFSKGGWEKTRLAIAIVLKRKSKRRLFLRLGPKFKSKIFSVLFQYPRWC